MIPGFGVSFFERRSCVSRHGKEETGGTRLPLLLHGIMMLMTMMEKGTTSAL